ncbi:MAG: c-type cytochrome [Daejeonella sp.]
MRNMKINWMILIAVLIQFSTTIIYAQPKPAWVTPKDANLIKNPFAGDKSTLAEAKVLYISNCSPCHGLKGKGDGAAAAALNPKPADHSSAQVQNETDGSLFWKISVGHTPMPPYKTVFTDKQRWELVNYIRTLSKSKK